MQQPQVRTPAGTFEGLWADDAQSIQVFKGIAYASPPVGPLRFKPPAPKPSLPGVTLAQTDPTPGWQAHSEDAFVWSRGVFPRSEDCLYLNKFVRSDVYHNRNTTLVPILFFIHGGGLVSGTITTD